jgi:uncharacterized protein YdbL (DUF1318 family)
MGFTLYDFVALCETRLFTIYHYLFRSYSVEHHPIRRNIMKNTLHMIFALAMVVVVSCITVNIYFPAAAIQKAADEIVDDIRGKDQDLEQKKPEQKQVPTSLLERLRYTGLGASEAYAAVDIDVSTPAIRGFKESMKNRFPALEPFYGKGALGENNKGFVEIRNADALSLKERADLNRLSQQENSDRSALYKEILSANKLGPDMMEQTQKLFANSWRSKSRPGWWIQQDNGEWTKK